MRRRSRKERSFLSFYSIFAILGGLLLTAFIFAADKLADHNIHFYINYRGLTTGKMFVIIVFLACFLLVSGIAVFLHRHLRHVFLRGFIILCTIAVACYFAFATLFTALFFLPRSYTGAVSTNGEHRIIFGEDSRISSPYGGDIYERTSRFTIRKIGEYQTQNEFSKPFATRDFHIDWNETDFDVHYDYDGKGTYKTVTVRYLR